MKGGAAVLAGVLAGLVLIAGVISFGKDVERFWTDAERERRHPSAANFAREVGALARAVKAGIGISEV